MIWSFVTLLFELEGEHLRVVGSVDSGVKVHWQGHCGMFVVKTLYSHYSLFTQCLVVQKAERDKLGLKV